MVLCYIIICDYGNFKTKLVNVGKKCEQKINSAEIRIFVLIFF